MRRWLAVVGLVVILLLAGCSAVPEQPRLPTSGVTTAEQARHPFANQTVTVAIDGTDRERAIAADGLNYWETNAQQYAGFDVDFRIASASNVDTPDVHIQFVDTVTDCGNRTEAAGCAPRLNASTAFDRPATVRVGSGLANESTRLVVRHEVGHLLGLTHDDEPQAVMEHAKTLAVLPQPNATERPVPWDDQTVTVFVENDTIADDELAAFYEEVNYGLAYFRAGADGTGPDNLTIRLVETPGNADVIISAPAESDCREDAGSCSLVEGTDPDADGSIETYTRFEILLVDLDLEAISWHVARQFAEAVGITDAELPEPLRGTTYTERRSNWHGHRNN